MEYNQLKVVPYDRRFLDASWIWFQDEELRNLTNTPHITRQEQITWFETIEHRPGYLIWGIELAREPVGAFGLKNIEGEKAEYWGYLGIKNLWGKSIGNWLLYQAFEKARQLGISSLYLRVLSANLRAIRLYQKNGFVTTGFENDMVIMEINL